MEVTMTLLQRLCALFLLVLIPLIVFGQGSILRIPPYTVNGRFLNEQIVGDTLPNGQRADSNRIYVLNRGAGYYLSNTAIRNTGWRLRIRAQDSTGSRPRIFLANNPTTGRPPGQFIDMRGNVEIKNLIVSGYFEPNPADLGGLQGALFNTTAPGLNLIIDSCILTNTNGNHVRTDNAPRLVKITNSVFANMGYLGTSNLGAGKAVDVRGGSVDSLIMVNNTFVNWQDRIVRHFGSTAPIRYFRFDHNTLANGMSYHGMLSLGRLGNRALITNNLLVDHFSLGNDTDAVRQAEFTDSGELDAFGFPRMTWVISNPNDTINWTIRNNWYTITDSGQAFYNVPGGPPVPGGLPLRPGSPLTYNISRRLGADSVNAFRQTTVRLNNTPQLMNRMNRWYRAPVSDSGAAKTKNTGTFRTALHDYDRRGYLYYRDTLDARYPTSHALYTAADGGFPVGDLNWFPSQKAAWEIWYPTQDASEEGTIPEAYALEQNYPNPFNPSTTIAYALPKQSAVTLEVFDVLGRSVAKLVDEVKAAGSHTASFDGANLSSGIYFYRLTAGGTAMAKKMMILK
jgi:hypothetical protein